jgi:sulfur relay (sulfurtransferase) complex TusBCD TusD component (DsrE family)
VRNCDKGHESNRLVLRKVADEDGLLLKLCVASVDRRGSGEREDDVQGRETEELRKSRTFCTELDLCSTFLHGRLIFVTCKGIFRLSV